MKIIMPTFERIEWMPPTISLIENLADMGHEVVYVTIYPDLFFDDRKGKRQIQNVSLCKKNHSLQYRFPYIKGISGILLRLDNLVKKLVCRRLTGKIDQLMDDNSLLWVVNEMTVMLAGTGFLKNRDYAFTVYELHEKTRKLKSIEKAAKGARVVVVPEYCRAHIMQSRYNLRKTPVVLPNKTTIKVMNTSLSEQAREAVALLEQRRREGKKSVLYMGGVGPERPLEPVLEAIGNSDQYRLAVMGRESVYLNQLRQKYPGQFDYLGAFQPPEHIQVAAYAQIGLLMYVSLNQVQGLNALFCAPNKLYEYTGQGLPVIANDIPGLRFPIEMNQIGCVADFSESQSILTALDKIGKYYEDYVTNARTFFQKTDVNQLIQDVLDHFGAQTI